MERKAIRENSGSSQGGQEGNESLRYKPPSLVFTNACSVCRTALNIYQSKPWKCYDDLGFSLVGVFVR